MAGSRDHHRDHEPRGRRTGSVRARHRLRSLRWEPSALQPGRLHTRTLCPRAQAVGLQDRASGPGSCYSRAPGLLPWGSPMRSDKTRPPTLTAHGARSPGFIQSRTRDWAFPPVPGSRLPSDVRASVSVVLQLSAMSHRRTVLSQEALAKTDFIGLKHRPLIGPSWPDKTYGRSEKSSEDERRPAGRPGVQRPWPLGCGVGQEGEPAQESACKWCCPCPGCDSVPHSSQVSQAPSPHPSPRPRAQLLDSRPLRRGACPSAWTR